MTNNKKVCIVTGGSSGIGLASAKRFASEGYQLAICGRRQEKLDAALTLFESTSNAIAVCGDIGKQAIQQQLIHQTIETFGRIDVLVNNAGAAPLATIENIDTAIFDEVFQTNIRAAFALSQSAWKHMAESGGGTIVNISSMAAIDPFPGFSIYGASKAWIELFSKAIAAEGEEQAIRVCCVRPGAVETDLLRGLFPDYPADQCVSPDEIADKVWACVADPKNHPSGESFTVSRS